MVVTKTQSAPDLSCHKKIIRHHVHPMTPIMSPYSFRIGFPSIWVNDPVGMFMLNGVYYLLFQCGGIADEWDFGIGWGMARSTDGIRWELTTSRLLEPTPGGYDQDGCFSGCVVLREPGVYDVYYTGVVKTHHLSFDEHLLHARLEIVDDSIQMTKTIRPLLTKNKRIWLDMRDPHVVQFNGSEFILMGCRDIFGRGNVRAYKLHNVTKLSDCGNILQGVDDCMIECPSLTFVSEDTWMLMVSMDHVAEEKRMSLYSFGTFDGERFVFQRPDKKVDHGNCLYAATVFHVDHKPVLMGWIVGASKSQNSITMPRKLEFTRDHTGWKVIQTSCMFPEDANASLIGGGVTESFQDGVATTLLASK